MVFSDACNPVNSQPEVFRPLANFPPSLWGDHFCSVSLDNQVLEMYAKEIEILKEKVKSMLVDAESEAAEKMKLINTLERLGVSYHFVKEIEEQLEQIFESYAHFQNDEDYNDLSTAAVHFCVFRQHGYKMSCDVFNKFKDCNGKFNENLTTDVMGMLSLYDASHLRIHGEDILDEALSFTTTHLECMVTDKLSPFLAKQVILALKQPLHKGIPRVEARHYISIYQEDVSKNELLLKLAKLDFNWLQSMHKQELCHISRWDISANDQLPDYMKIFYGRLLGLYEELEKEMMKQGRSYSVDYSKDTVKELARSYYIETKWFNERYVPSFDEYMGNALITGTYYLLATTSLMGMGEIATVEAFDWVQTKPKILVASNTVTRLMDDIVTHEEEEKRGHVAMGIECYVKQHGLSKEEAMDGMSRKIEHSWKDINEECLTKPNSKISMHLLMRVLNLTRVIDVYKCDDGYTHPERVLKDHIVSMFIDPIPL